MEDIHLLNGEELNQPDTHVVLLNGNILGVTTRPKEFIDQVFLFAYLTRSYVVVVLVFFVFFLFLVSNAAPQRLRFGTREYLSQPHSALRVSGVGCWPNLPVCCVHLYF